MSNELIERKEMYDGQVAEFVLGGGPGNILTGKLMRELQNGIRDVSGDSPANRKRKLLVVSGEGKHFSYGASVEEHKREIVGDMLPVFHALIGRILECDIPTLAKVSGLCLGGGFELALACAMIFCDEDSKFGVPEIQLGVFPPVACVLLPLKTSDGAASRMILTGEHHTAEELHRLGIVNVVAKRGELDATVARFIEAQILPKSASSLRIACRAARTRVSRWYRDHIDEVENLYLEELMSTDDAAEGIVSFLEKRPPKWKNA